MVETILPATENCPEEITDYRVVSSECEVSYVDLIAPDLSLESKNRTNLMASYITSSLPYIGS